MSTEATKDETGGMSNENHLPKILQVWAGAWVAFYVLTVFPVFLGITWFLDYETVSSPSNEILVIILICLMLSIGTTVVIFTSLLLKEKEFGDSPDQMLTLGKQALIYGNIPGLLWLFLLKLKKKRR